MGGEVVRRGQAGSPGSGGASPYLRRGLLRPPAPDASAYGVEPPKLSLGAPSALGHAIKCLNSRAEGQDLVCV
jgi:hypothetical protein